MKTPYRVRSFAAGTAYGLPCPASCQYIGGYSYLPQFGTPVSESTINKSGPLTISQQIRRTTWNLRKRKSGTSLRAWTTTRPQGEDGITGVIYNHAFQTVPTFITAIYNGCLKQGIFPPKWKIAKLIPIIKPGQENSQEVSKYRPISLLNIGGKILKKLLINRKNHHISTTEYINKNQFGFRPQTSTVDAVMALKGYIEQGFRSGESNCIS
jgi:hypothetical protein